MKTNILNVSGPFSHCQQAKYTFHKKLLNECSPNPFPGSVGERRGGGGGSQSGQQVNGRSPSGPGSGGRDRARPAARRGGLGAGGERSQASASRRLRPRPRRSPGLEVGGVTRPGLERNRAHPAAGADRYWLCRLVSAPARSRIASFRTSTDKFT